MSSVHAECSMSIRTKISRAAASASTVAEERPAEVEVDLEPERRQLDRDVGVEPVGGDRVERSVVRGRDRLCLGRTSHLLAEHVDRRELPLRVQAGDRSRRASSSVGPGDVRSGEPLDDGPRHGREEPNDSPVRDVALHSRFYEDARHLHQ